ncbi:MAG: hypothetical protein ABSG04_11290 [Verrucomicrobiota bacterium]
MLENDIATSRKKVLQFPLMKSLSPATHRAAQRRVSKWIPGGVGNAAISKLEAARFTDGLLKIAARIEGLPPDFAKNHDHYLHGLPRK